MGTHWDWLESRWALRNWGPSADNLFEKFCWEEKLREIKWAQERVSFLFCYFWCVCILRCEMIERFFFMLLEMIQERDKKRWWWCRREREYCWIDVLEELGKCGSSKIMTTARYVDSATVKEEGRENSFLYIIGYECELRWTEKSAALYGFLLFLFLGMKLGHQLGMRGEGMG